MPLQLPPDGGAEREAAIRDYVRHGLFQVEWATITSTHNGHTAEFQVFSDALRIEGVRVNVSAETAQIIADMTGCILLTPKLADLMWAQRQITLGPAPRAITATTAAMVEHSAKIDAALAALGNPTGIVQTVGKHWVLTQRLASSPGRAANYGWHFEGAAFQGIRGEASASLPGVRVIQGVGTAHDPHHADYSQTLTLGALACRVDGGAGDIRDVLRDPALAPLASHEGPLTFFRQPSVPEPTDRTIVLPQITLTDDRETPIPTG